MKKVIRLNEQDIEKLVKKIIKEDKTSINEGPLGWLRKKFNSDEEIGLSILKGIKLGEATNVEKVYENNYRSHDTYDFKLNNHSIRARVSSNHITPSSLGSNTNYYLSVDDEYLEVSRNTIKNIIYNLDNVIKQPIENKRKSKVKDIKTSMSRYNLPDEERNKLENPETYFGELN